MGTKNSLCEREKTKEKNDWGHEGKSWEVGGLDPSLPPPPTPPPKDHIKESWNDCSLINQPADFPHNVPTIKFSTLKGTNNVCYNGMEKTITRKQTMTSIGIGRVWGQWNLLWNFHTTNRSKDKVSQHYKKLTKELLEIEYKIQPLCTNCSNINQNWTGLQQTATVNLPARRIACVRSQIVSDSIRRSHESIYRYDYFS